jgi:hypothetical protein
VAQPKRLISASVFLPHGSRSLTLRAASDYGSVVRVQDSLFPTWDAILPRKLRRWQAPALDHPINSSVAATITFAQMFLP